MQRFFNEVFIAQCKEMQPKKNVQTSLLNDQKCAQIFERMALLRCDKTGTPLLVQPGYDPETEYDKFLIYLRQTEVWFTPRDKQYADFCKKLINFIVDFVKIQWPEFHNKLIDEAEMYQRKIDDEKLIRFCNRCGTGCCCIWSLVQQPVTLFNLARQKSIKLEKGDIHCCDAVSSVRSLCEDNNERSQDIQKFESKGARIHAACSRYSPPRPQMMS